MNLPPLPTTGIVTVDKTYTPMSLYTEDQMREYAAEAVRLSQDKRPVQVSPLQFVEMVYEKENRTGMPIVWAQWPNHPEEQE